MSNSDTLASSSRPPVIPMVPPLQQLFKACNKGDFSLCNHLIIADKGILLSTTPHKNNCLHIAAMLGHHEFAQEVLSRAPSLISDTNIDGETPLIAALMAANLSLASDIITAATLLEEGRLLNCMLLKADRRKENALHHAMRNGFEDFAVQLLNMEPELSEQVTNIGESPMYMAARRGYSRVIEQLLQIPSSANSRPRTESDLAAAVRLDHTGYSEVVERLQEIPSSAFCGPNNQSAMHAAVRFDHPGSSDVVEGLLAIPSPAVFGPYNDSAMHAAVMYDHPGIVKQLLERQSHLAYHKDKHGNNPMHKAVLENKLMLVKKFLEYDPNLAYIKHEPTGWTPFITAVTNGFVLIAKYIMNTCPDSVYTPISNGDSALHLAISNEKLDSFDYILSTPQLRRFINQANNDGELPLHYAAYKCDPKLLRSLLTQERQDYTALSVWNGNAVNIVYAQTNLWKTLKWNESFTLLSNVIPSGWNSLIRDKVKQTIKQQAIKDVKLLTQNYTSNTSLVAALLATITFAAAFTLPGGFSTDQSDAGQPLFARKAAFQVFLISDTIAMCSSLAVAFLCVLATWEDSWRRVGGLWSYCTCVWYWFVHSDSPRQLVACNSHTSTLHHPPTLLQDNG